MRRALGYRDPALVVDLRRRHVPVTEQILDFTDINPGPEQERGRRPERMGRIDAPRRYAAVGTRVALNCIGKAGQISHHDLVHAHRVKGAISKLVRIRSPPRPKEWTAR